MDLNSDQGCGKICFGTRYTMKHMFALEEE